YAQGGDRTRLQATQADRLARLLAVAVGAFLDALEGVVDAGDQLALAVARAELQRAVGLKRGAVGDVGRGERLFLEMPERLRRLLQQLRAPAQELLPEILALQGVHELLVLGRTIIRGKQRWHLLAR